MRFRASLAWVAVLLICGSALAQTNRLGEVAGTITLDSSALTKSGGGYVEDENAAKTADQSLIKEVLEQCVGEATKIADLVAVIKTSWSRVGDDRWIRLENSAAALEEAVEDLYSLRLVDTFQGALVASRDAAEICGGASKAVKSELDRRIVEFTEGGPAIAECRRVLDAAVSLVAAADAGSAGTPSSSTSESGAELVSDLPPTPEEIIAAFCESERSRGQAAFDECEDRQFRALAALESRSPSMESLAENVFAEIRENCRSEHPNEFVQQDLCEQERMTATRIQAETGS